MSSDYLTKNKGLQKLKYYCEMCKKQCPDENGFRCHLASENHQRMMRLFAENREQYIGEFSKEFEQGFIDILKRKYPNKRVFANKVYAEYISNKSHTHMNATRWTTLSEFTRYLGDSGKCIIEEAEKGHYIQYIDKGPDAIAKKIAEEKRMKIEQLRNLKEQKDMVLLEKQIEQAKKLEQEKLGQNPKEGNFPITDADDKIIDLNSMPHIEIDLKNIGRTKSNTETASPKIKDTKPNLFSHLMPISPEKTLIGMSINSKVNDKLSITRFDSNLSSPKATDKHFLSGKIYSNSPEVHLGKRKPLSSMDRLLDTIKHDKDFKLIKTQKKANGAIAVDNNKIDAPQRVESQDKLVQQNNEEEDSWICEGIIIRIKDKDLPKFYDKKAKITRVISLFMAEVAMLENNAKIVIDQAFLETVIPVTFLFSLLISPNKFPLQQEYRRNRQNSQTRIIFPQVGYIRKCSSRFIYWKCKITS